MKINKIKDNVYELVYESKTNEEKRVKFNSKSLCFIKPSKHIILITSDYENNIYQKIVSDFKNENEYDEFASEIYAMEEFYKVFEFVNNSIYVNMKIIKTMMIVSEMFMYHIEKDKYYKQNEQFTYLIDFYYTSLRTDITSIEYAALRDLMNNYNRFNTYTK